MPLILPVLLALLAAGGQGQVPDLPVHLREQFARGIEAQKAGNLEEAEGIFKTLLDQGSRLLPVYNALGNIYQMKGEHKRALEAFKASEQLDPKDPIHHALAGASLQALGRTREAVREFRQAVRLDPDNLLFREQLGAAYLYREDYPGAIEQYARLVELKSENPEYQYQLGHAYLEYSLSCFRKIKDINARSARLYQEMGDQYLVQGKLDKAIESYEKARVADPSIPEVHFLLGQCYLKKGDREKALVAIDQALALTPGSPAALALKKVILADAAKH